MLVLNFLELLDNVVRPFFETYICLCGPHQTHGGEVMSRDVAREIPSAPIPTVVRFSLRLQPCTLAVISQHPIGFELKQILGVQVLGSLERPAK